MVGPIFISFSVILLAVMFFVAGLSKIRALDTFEGVVQNFRVLPAGMVRPFALALPTVEIAVAAALIIPATRLLGAVAACFLLLIFTIAIAVNLTRGRREIDCGCFSSELKQNLSGWLVARNLLLASCTLIVIGILTDASAPIMATPPLQAWLLGVVSAGFVILIYLTATTLSSVANIAAHRRSLAENVKA